MSYNEGKESENLSLMQELAQDDRLPSLASNPEDEIFTIPA